MADVRNNPEAQRYELHLEGRLAGVADYRLQGDAIVFPHTEIDPSIRGQGLGAVLVKAALDDVRGTGRRVVPACWFVAEFISDNPDYQDLLAA